MKCFGQIPPLSPPLKGRSCFQCLRAPTRGFHSVVQEPAVSASSGTCPDLGPIPDLQIRCSEGGTQRSVFFQALQVRLRMPTLGTRALHSNNLQVRNVTQSCHLVVFLGNYILNTISTTSPF